MMLPGAQYVGYLVIGVATLAASWFCAAIIAVIFGFLTSCLIDKTKTRQEQISGRKEPEGGWPWWINNRIWIKAFFWISVAIFGYVLAGPALYVAKML